MRKQLNTTKASELTPDAKRAAIMKAGKKRAKRTRSTRDRPNGVGAPPALTKKREDAIVKYIEEGATRAAAAMASGVTARIIFIWFQRARAEIEAREEGALPNKREDRYVRLFRRVEQAEGMWETGMTAVVHKATATDWKAAAWVLERRRPHDYGRRSTVAVTGLSPDESAKSDTARGAVSGQTTAELIRELESLGLSASDIAKLAKHEPMPDKAVRVVGAVIAESEGDA